MLKRSIQRFLSSWGFWSVGALAMAAAVFGVLLGPNAVLQGIDFSYGSVIQRASGMPESFLGAWHSRGLLGGAGSTSLTAMNLLLWLLPEELLGNWMYALWLVVASVFLCAFLRLRGCSRVSCLVSSAAFWTGTNLTLVYAGHMQKFGVVALCMVALYCLEKSVRSCSWRWAVLAGGALGAMFLEQQDVALFMGLFVGAYALFAVWREALDPSRDKRNTWGRFVQRLGVCLGPVLVVSLLLVGPTIRSTYRTKVSDTTSVGKGAGTEQKWDFCTQWSLPPEETLDLIVPNFFGIRTGEPKGPYWGRTGQSAGWSEKQAGLRNLRYEGIYVGVVPVLLGLLALAIVCTGRSELPSREETPVSCDKVSVEADARRSDTFFWFGVLSVSLLLSWGRFFPLYRLFWQLPMINAIRNPNKHLHILQVAVGILAAFGLDALLRGVWQSRKGGRRVVWAGVIASVGLAATLAVAMVLVGSSRGALTRGFAADGFGGGAEMIVANMVGALRHGATMAFVGGLCMAGMIWFRGLSDRKWPGRAVVSCACILLVVLGLDYVHYSRDYVKSMDAHATVRANDVTEFLDENLGQQRVMLFSQAGFYNQWLTMLFRAQGIAAFNMPSMERLPRQLRDFLSIGQANPARMWELASVGYALGPAAVWPQVQAHPNLRGAFEPVMGFDVYGRKGGVVAAKTRPGQQPQHLVYRFKKGMDRYTMVPGKRVVSDEAMCGVLGSPMFDPRREVLVTPEDANRILAAPSGPGIDAGSVEVIEETGRTMHLKTQSGSPQVLLVSQRYAPDYVATIDGRPADVVRCNYVCLGLPVPPGKHDVVIRCQPSLTGLYIQIAGVLAVLGAAVSMVLVACRGPREPERKAADV